MCVYMYYVMLYLGLQPIVSQFGGELKGDERVVVDQMITEQQCQRLIDLASVSFGEGSCL